MPCRIDPTPEELAEDQRRYEERLTGPLHREIDVLRSALGERDAMLCAVMLSLERDGGMPNVLDRIDGQEAGVSRHAIETWWQEHRIRDAEQRAREAKRQALERARELGLTEDEIQALAG